MNTWKAKARASRPPMIAIKDGAYCVSFFVHLAIVMMTIQNALAIEKTGPMNGNSDLLMH